MNRKAIRILLLSGVVSLQSACGAGSEGDCAKRIKEEIRPGVQVEVADADLKKCGFETSIDSSKKTLYGDKRVGKGIVSERTQVVIGLNPNHTVATISVSTGLIGP